MEYEVRRSYRKTVGLEITNEGKVLVRAPILMTDSQIKDFVFKYGDWIDTKLKVAEASAERNNAINRKEKELRLKAEDILPPLIEKYSRMTGLYPTGVKITSAEKRFGSCSGKNSLCFSWRLMAYPIEAIEYVVLHEIVHIKHHNHSKAFYRLIEKYMPDYKNRVKKLKYEEK